MAALPALGARRFASPAYSDREYVITHVIAILVALAAAALLSTFPFRWVVFGFFALVFGPAIFCNALFHAAASLRPRAYCPRVLTGLVVYLPSPSWSLALPSATG